MIQVAKKRDALPENVLTFAPFEEGVIEVGEEGDAERACEDHRVHDDVIQRKSFDVVQRHSNVVLRQRRIRQDFALDSVVLLEAGGGEEGGG